MSPIVATRPLCVSCSAAFEPRMDAKRREWKLFFWKVYLAWASFSGGWIRDSQAISAISRVNASRWLPQREVLAFNGGRYR